MGRGGRVSLPLFSLPLWLAVTWIPPALAADAPHGCGPHVGWRRRLRGRGGAHVVAPRPPPTRPSAYEEEGSQQGRALLTVSVGRAGAVGGRVPPPATGVAGGPPGVRLLPPSPGPTRRRGGPRPGSIGLGGDGVGGRVGAFPFVSAGGRSAASNIHRHAHTLLYGNPASSSPLLRDRLACS